MKLLLILTLSLFSLNAFCWQYATPIASPITNTTGVTIKAITGSSSQNLLMAMQMINTSATATIVTIKDGSTVVWTGYLPASMTNMTHVYFPRPLYIVGAVTFTCNTTGASVFVNAQGTEGR